MPSHSREKWLRPENNEPVPSIETAGTASTTGSMFPCLGHTLTQSLIEAFWLLAALVGLGYGAFDQTCWLYSKPIMAALAPFCSDDAMLIVRIKDFALC